MSNHLKFATIVGFIFLVVFIFLGYRPEVKVTQNSLIGEYEYRTGDIQEIVTNYEWNHLTLESDGTYVLVEGGRTRTKREKEGHWQYTEGEPGGLRLDDAGFPVVGEHGEIRLMISYDIPVFYEKVN